MAATNKRGVFSLEKVLERQGDNNWTDIFDPFIYVSRINPEQVAGPAAGYFAAGYNSNGYYYMSFTQRLDYDNDTSQTVTKGNLPLEINECHGGTGNTTYGYTFGGRGPSPSNNRLSSTFRIEYASDTALASEKGPLSSGRRMNSSIGNANYGYAGGGYNINYSAMDKLDYSNDTTATTNSDGLNPSRYSYACTGNQNYGYFISGNDPSYGYRTTVSRLDYSNDGAATSPKGPLPNPAYANSGTGNADYGYVDRGGGDNYSSRIYRIDYANDTSTALQRGPLNYQAQTRVATGNGTTGYFAGGFSPSGTGLANNSGIDYSNDTATASPKGGLVIGCSYGFNFSPREYGLPQTSSERSVIPATQYEPPIQAGGPAYGYVAGGDYTQQVSRIDYANDTATASPRGPLTSGRSRAGGTGNLNYGYVTGGVETPVDPTSKVDRIDYSNDSSTASPKGKLSAARKYLGSVGNANYGYTGGGSDAPSPTYAYQSRMDRIDYANDTATATSLGNIFVPHTSSAQYGTAGNLNYGYMAGGGFPRTSICRRIDYANDSVAASPKGPLSSEASDNAGTGNINFGYFQTNRGYLSPTTICRLDYANDTNTASPKGPLVATVYRRTATGSQSFGYFCGGGQQPTKYSFVERIDYANDTATASPKGNLAFDQGRSQSFSGQENAFGGTPSESKLVDKGSDGYIETTTPSPISYGLPYVYTVGGIYYNQASGTSRVTRIDYSNSSQSSMPNLSDVSMYLSGTNNKDYGWLAGESKSGTGTTNAYRIDFSTGASTFIPGIMRNRGRYRGAVGNVNYGYFCGGTDDNSSVDRVDFANDTTTAVGKGPLNHGGQYKSGTGNKNYGWMGGGPSPQIDKIDYSNDTVTSPGASSMGGGWGSAATGNANKGYWKQGVVYPNVRSTVYRFDYANDTVNASSVANLPQSVGGSAGGSSETFGLFCGGYTNGYQPSTSLSQYAQSINYSNDTTSYGYGIPYMTAVGAVSSRSNDVYTGGPVTGYIPRIRFIDLAEEGSGGGGESPTPPAPTGPSGPAYGYQTGGDGYSPSGTRVERIDFENDTATSSPRTYLSVGNRNIVRHGATGNLTHGYTYGGGSYSNITKLDYANDTTAAPTTAYLGTPSNDYLSSVGNNDYGYTGGRPWSYYYYLGKFDYSNDTTNETILSPSGFGPSPTSYGYGGAGNRNYGYFMGGSSSTMVRRIDYANDTAQAAIKGPLVANAPYCCATGNNDFGYSTYGPSWSVQTGINRIDYANDTANALQRGTLSASSGYRGAVGSQDYGYFCGGYSNRTTIDRVDYANDTPTASPKGNLSVAMYRQAGYSAKEYGHPPDPAPPAPSGPSPDDNSIVAPFQPPFPFPVQSLIPTDYGYFAGGRNPSTVGQYSKIQRIDYTNDTSTALVKGKLSISYTGESAGTSNFFYGYLAGFDGNPLQNIAERIDFSNDTATALQKSNAITPSYDVAAVGNKFYGYWAGGWPSSGNTRISRLDFSNDDAGGSERGSLTLGRAQMSGVSNQSHGYIGGGYNPGPVGNPTSIDRIDFSNDNVTALLKGNLTTGRQDFVAGMGNSNYGYIAAGAPPFDLSTVERIDYANDTNTANPRGPLSIERRHTSGTGNSSYGYVGGGERVNSPQYISTVDRIDFANDNVTSSPKGPLESAVGDAGAVSAAAAGNTI